MIRKYALSMSGAVLLAGFVVLLFNSNALAQKPQPEAVLSPAIDVGPSFTYQGYLQQSGVAVNGSCDFEFRLFNALTTGTQIGPTQPINGQAISQGRFTVELNFGASAIDGQARWLQIAVRCPAGSGAFTTLAPRQVLTATPYALSLRPGAVVVGTVSSAGTLNLTNNGTSGSDSGLNVVSAPIGIQVTSASYVGVQVNSAGGAGVYVDSAGNNGLQVGSATRNGVHVDSAGQDGLFVCATGSNTTCTPNDSAHNGVEIGNAKHMGLDVENAGTFGVGVYSSGDDGVRVEAAGLDGLQITSAGDDGVYVAAATNAAGRFNGPLFAQTCTGCLLATFGVNASNTALKPGDIVALQGTRTSQIMGQSMLMEVGPARAGNTVIGIVYGRGELLVDENSEGGKTMPRLAPRDGAAAPGDYVHIVIYGTVQVKASALGKAIGMGEKLAVNDLGAARALQTIEVSGVRLAESVPTIGIALESLGANQNGLIWVLVSPQ